MVAVYFLVLAGLLGLDIVGAVPPAVASLLTAGLGVVASVAVAGGFYLFAANPDNDGGVLARLGMGMAIVAGSAGVVALARLIAAPGPGNRPR